MFLCRLLCPLNVQGMAEQDIREDQMTSVDSVDYVRGLKGKDSVLIKPGDLPHPNTGGETISANLQSGKWYRIAIGYPGNATSSGLFNMGNEFAYDSAAVILFYAFAEGYNNGAFITKVAASNRLPISKARVLSAKSTTERSYLDIYVRLSGSNKFVISAAALINFKLQTPEEVSEAIPEGYSVKEVSF